MAAYAAIYGGFAFPPLQVLDWIPLLLLGVLIVFSIDDARNFSPGVRVSLQGVFALSMSSLLLWPVVSQIDFMRTTFTVSGVAVIWFGLWTHADQSAQRNAMSGVTIIAAAAGVAVVSTIMGSILLGQLGAALASALSGWLLWHCLRVQCPMGHAGTAVAMVTLGCLLLVAHFYSELSMSSSLLLLAALGANLPVSLLQRSQPGLSTQRAAVLTGLAALVPVAIAIAITVLFDMSEDSGYGRY
ncbi:putative uncharacterized protein [Methylocaldum marinum]|uniref:Uncharacterized protein n=1 Tax=Methylocaldum marinum TaxID=1432792 RepID=A0A250KU30_9GAMM|nr:putative uncharacterized protein [Methylocaldum marinum]